MEFALEKELMMIGRLLIAGLCGGVIGHERENRRKPAGVRTHTVVGVASALMMLISKYGFNDVLNEYTKLDPSRVAAGLVAGCAGCVFGFGDSHCHCAPCPDPAGGGAAQIRPVS